MHMNASFVKFVQLCALATITLVSIACSTQDPVLDAQRLTVAELNTSAGYVWFPTESRLYVPRQEFVSLVRDRFTTDTRFLIFVRPTCSCRGTQKLFPQVIRVLLDAQVPESNIEIYSVRSNQDKHPYMDQIALGNLPAVYVQRSSSIAPKTILDEDYTGLNADSLVANVVQ